MVEDNVRVVSQAAGIRAVVRGGSNQDTRIHSSAFIQIEARQRRGATN